MRITMRFDGGPLDGEVAFDRACDRDSLPQPQRLAAEIYDETCGLVGRFCCVGTSNGAFGETYEVFRAVDHPLGCDVWLRLL